MNKYVSIDIETTGLDLETCQIIEFGAIIEDINNPLSFDEIPKFKRIIKHPAYTGSAFAINMNARIFAELAKDKPDEEFTYPGLLTDEFVAFLKENGFTESHIDNRIKIVAAGKNFISFDNVFLRKLPKWNSKIAIGHRALDPGMLYLDMQIDEDIPSLGLCKQRANISGIVTHNALEDAWDVIQVLRAYRDK